MLLKPVTWMTRVRSTAQPTSAPAPAASPPQKSATRGSATRPCGSSLTRQGTSDTSNRKKKHRCWRFSKWLISDKSWMSTTRDLFQEAERFWSGSVRGVVRITINNHLPFLFWVSSFQRRALTSIQSSNTKDVCLFWPYCKKWCETC